MSSQEQTTTPLPDSEAPHQTNQTLVDQEAQTPSCWQQKEMADAACQTTAACTNQEDESDLQCEMEAFAQEMQEEREELETEWASLMGEKARLLADQIAVSDQKLMLRISQEELEQEQQQFRRDSHKIKELKELQVTVQSMIAKMRQIEQQADTAARDELKEVQKLVVQLKEELQGQNETIVILHQRIKELEEEKQEEVATNIAPVEAEEEKQEEVATNIAPAEAEEKQEGLQQLTEVICSREEATSGEELQKTSKEPSAWKRFTKAFTRGSKNEKKENQKAMKKNKEGKKTYGRKKLLMDESPHVVEADEETPQQAELCSSKPRRFSQRPSAWGRFVKFLSRKKREEEDE